ncbi:MAG: formate dehydrogenase accessory protein FdhE [Desulfobulbaceae bacterium]|nr:formate dehydrogenase accessory protein FdhE [Desulfobulbaceae bacterium]
MSQGTAASDACGAASSIARMDVSELYARRSARLRSFAATGGGMAGYFLFAAQLVDWQRDYLAQTPLAPPKQPAPPLLIDWRTPPLAASVGIADLYWQRALDALLEAWPRQRQNPAIVSTLAAVAALERGERETAALALLQGDIASVGSAKAPFFWAALSLFWGQWARLRPLEIQERVGAARDLCPLCGGAPVASLVAAAPADGLRYLHCSLCESAWRLTRAQCAVCEQSGRLQYWSLDGRKSVQSESCGDCMSQLKILHRNETPDIDPAADDLASLALDALLEEKGFSRSGVNPFLFPGASPGDAA